LVALVAISATLCVICQPELFGRKLLVWLLEAYALERILLIGAAIRLLLDEGLEWDTSGTLALSGIPS
jgi:hypothetical protein